MLPPIVPHLPLGDYTEMPNLVEHMPCKIKWQGFLPRIPNQKAMNNCLDTHNLRPGLWQARGSSLHMNRYAIDSLISHRTTVADKHWWGFLHTHLPMFWVQSSVEHHCCQRLRLHAHNNQTASRMLITEDATAAFFDPTSQKKLNRY